MFIESNTQMPLITRENNTILVCFDEQTITREENTIYTYQGVRVPFPYTYPTVVAAIIKDQYDDDQREAIINNHLDEDPSPEHEAEFAALQAWRHHAKEVAHLVCDPS